MVTEKTCHIYLVVSQTGTFLSRILKRITGAQYNHVSIGLTKDLEIMYSFGRLYPYNPIMGGFVKESPHFGTFKRFHNTEVTVLDLEIDQQKYDSICKMLEMMLHNRKKYHYNYLGLFLAAFKIVFKAKNCFYCSEFVRHVLQKHDIEGSFELEAIIQPVHFLEFPNTNKIYTGKLKDYRLQEPVEVSKI